MGLAREIEIVLPTLHPDQVRCWNALTRFTAIRCGRRWGKTLALETIACDSVINAKSIGWFAPDWKIQREAQAEIADILAPIVTQSSQTAGVIKVIGGGRVDFWTLENERAGRSRKYHGIIIDEGAFTKKNMLGIWEQSIKPTLLDYHGWAIVASNTNGENPDNFFWQICNQPKHGFSDFLAPSHNNPYLPKEDLDQLEQDNHPLVYRQEYLAEFVDFSGVAFFSRENLLIGDQGVSYPIICDAVFAVVDTATKTGKENDGTAVSYWAYSRVNYGGIAPLICLDWDLTQIEGALLETWLPNVFRRCEELARDCRARNGSAGAWIEDKSSGMVLLQHAKARGWPAQAIESKLTAMGKTERAMAASGPVYQGKVKFSKVAHDRVSVYKGVSRNHLEGQVFGFRIGQKEPAEDDLLDTLCYSVSIALGNKDGF